MYLGYVRVSTGKQTVENQMFAIEDFCAVSVKAEDGLKRQRRYEILILEKS